MSEKFARVLVFNPNGVMRTELDVELESVSWRLDGVGMAKFSMSWNDPKCTKDNLKYGNRILIQFSEDLGLPYWGGVIDVPRDVEYGVVSATAYTGEHLLEWRETGKNDEYLTANPGYIVQQMIIKSNAIWPTGMVLGDIYLGGTARSRTYHFHELYTQIKDLARLTGYDFCVRPVLSTGNVLTFAMDWFQQRGLDRRNSVWLIDGSNAKEPKLKEQGNIANRIMIAGAGTAWGAARPVSEVEDTASRDEYDYREWAEVQSGVADQDTLDLNAAEILTEMKDAKKKITISATNEGPAGFDAYGVGDIVTASLFVDNQEWYFEAPVRILARAWEPDHSCRLEVEEWTR